MPGGARLGRAWERCIILWFMGIEQGNIVFDDTDRKMLVDCMDLLVKGSDKEVSAFALLPVTGRLRLLDKRGSEGC